MATLSIQNVNKNYGSVKALANVSIDVDDGEVLVLVGPSGCGKSTLLRMIAGLEELTGGKMVLGGRDVSYTDPKDRDVAMVFQNYALYPHMTVFDNMAFSLKQKRLPMAEIREKVQEAARILDLEPLLDRKPSALSGGQRQRVAMGRAIVRNPAIYLMDEPLSNLDAKLRVQMRAELKLLRERLGVTTVYVTHDQVEAMTLGDRVAVLAPYSDNFASNLQQVDAPHKLYEEPRNMFVAGFIGSPAMNFFQAEIRQRGNSITAAINGTDITFDLTAAQHPHLAALEGYVGKTVVLGLRPEYFDAPSGSVERQETTLDVLVSEVVGPDAFLHFDLPTPTVKADFSRSNDSADVGLAGARFTARVMSEKVQVREGKVKLEINTKKLHFFDELTTDRIGHHGP